MTRLFLGVAPFALIAGAAHAGDTVLYEDAPGWVQQADVLALAKSSQRAQLLYEWQYRIEDGVVHAYTDRAIRIDNPQTLMQENTLSIAWLPDKGDLTIHRLEIIRNGEIIDLHANGASFEVLRREQGLEQRLLDGELTATLSVPGLREGDVLRTAFTTSTDDQALGDEVQVTQLLFNEPWLVGQSRAVVSWPADEEMYWGAEEPAGLTGPVRRGDDMVIDLSLPLAKPEQLPADAPWRFRRPTVLRVGSFASWDELSQVMYPHFAQAAQVAQGSPVAEQARAIMAKSSDPRQRAALATQLVQDEVSYLLNGLNGGNYLPQSAEQTWKLRYGDCKAKSVLLHALLTEMGINSQVVLVSSGGGDAVPELLPLPAAFDHMIVRAQIDEVNYWLDGTSAGTRLSNIDAVPPFWHALPLTAQGTGLVAMEQRNPAQPQVMLDVRLDHSAGVDLPVLVTFDFHLRGPASAQMRAIVDADDPQLLRRLASTFNPGGLEGMQVSDLSVTYDHELAEAVITVKGVASTDFSWENGRMRLNLSDSMASASFNPDRSRTSWRDIPVVTQGTSRIARDQSIVLPGAGAGYRLIGEPQIDANFANTRFVMDAALEGGVLKMSSETINLLGEIASADLPEARRAARMISSRSLEVAPPEDFTWRWERTAKERAALAVPILEAYDQAVLFAEKDNHVPLQWQASFKSSIFDFPAALKDYDWLVDVDPGRWAYQQRAMTHYALGNREAAIADMRLAMDVDDGNSSAFQLIDWLAYENKIDEAEEMLFALPVSEAEKVVFADKQASLAALAGRVAEGHEVLLAMVQEKPQDASALNADCWFRGLFSHALEDALAVCTRAIERSDAPAAALDSRALVNYRTGDLQAALADADAALSLEPWLGATHYLRGIVLLDRDRKEEGRRAVNSALTMSPELEFIYARHGLKPAR